MFREYLANFQLLLAGHSEKCTPAASQSHLLLKTIACRLYDPHSPRRRFKVWLIQICTISQNDNLKARQPPLTLHLLSLSEQILG